MGTLEELPDGATAAVITVSDRSHGGLRHDTSGPLLAELLGELGFTVSGPVIVPDEIEAVQDALRSAVVSRYDVIVTTGGTGFAPRDITPEATRPMLERDAPGIVEALRQHRRDEVPTTILSRAVAGTIGHSFVCNLPGSVGGVRDGVAVLTPVIGHLVAQLRGGDH